MREKMITQYEAFDGKTFNTARECTEYERQNSHLQLAGLTAEQISAAFANPVDDPVAQALVTAGYTLVGRRRSAEIARKAAAGAQPIADGPPEPPSAPPLITAAEAEKQVRA
jgi:hypothetical protein